MFNKTKRYKIDFRCLTGSVIGIEGLIGVGKTTIGKSLVKFLNKNGFKAKFYKEKVNKPLLDLYLSDMKNNAFLFQQIALQNRLNIYKNATNFAKTGGIAIIDRTLPGDMTFAKMQNKKGFFTEQQWDIYKNTLQNRKKDSPSLIAYFRVSPNLAYYRMCKRNNKSEKSGYTVSYFEELDKSYNEVIDSIRDRINVLNIDWSKDLNIINNVIDDSQVINVLYKFRNALIN